MSEKFDNTENMEMEDNFLVDLFDDDGNKQTFEHLDTVQVNDTDYVICIPYKEEEDDEVDEVVILKIEVQGAQKVMEKLGDRVVTIFLLPPSFEELERRLRNRQSDTPEQIESRLKIARDELACAPNYDYVVVNDDLTVAVEDILSVFRAEKRKTKRNKKIISEVCKNA